ncbi:MAG: YlbF family regulator [Lachnospiraceae bacterium]|nr:YlbF family regulator [Lachnospiraceae bacterium]
MKQVEKATDYLISEIKQSNRYIRYQESLENLKSQKKLFEVFDEFRKKHYKLNMESEDNFDEMEKLQQNYHDILMNSDVVDFMEATDRLCLMMREIYIKIANEVEMDIDFIDQI